MKCQKCNAIAGLYRLPDGAHCDLDKFEREIYSGRKITLDANGICQRCRPKRRQLPLFDAARPAPAGATEADDASL